MGTRPTHPVTATDMLLDCLLDELQTQNNTLQQILDRLPRPVEMQVAVSPAPAEPHTDKPAAEPVHIAEPVPERAPARKAPAKKATKATARKT